MSKHYVNALSLFKAKKYDEAALELRKGTAFLKLEFERASNKGDATLMKSIDDLEKFSLEVKKGAGVDVKMFQDLTGKAFYAVANHEYFEAYEYWANKKAAQAGQELKDLSDNLNSSLSGFDKSEDVKKTLAEVKSYADDMIKGLKVKSENIDKMIEKANKLLESTAKLFEKK